MNHLTSDPTKRFSRRVEAYLRYRPAYPPGVIEVLREETGLTAQTVIADIGSGTGISSELFLELGNTVFAVEPNPEMRQAAESKFQHCSNFVSVAARAEATTLPSGSVDIVVAGQAFHWFARQAARLEFARVLRRNGWVVLLWNSRRLDSTPFLRSYEALLLEYATDYRQVRHNNIDAATLQAFLAGGSFTTHRLDNEQNFDFEGLKGRLLSSSYAPMEGHPNYEPMLIQLADIFEQHETDGKVCFEYDTEIYIGRVGCDVAEQRAPQAATSRPR